HLTSASAPGRAVIQVRLSSASILENTRTSLGIKKRTAFTVCLTQPVSVTINVRASHQAVGVRVSTNAGIEGRMTSFPAYASTKWSQSDAKANRSGSRQLPA